MLSLESALRRAGTRRSDPAVSARRGPGRLLGLSGRAAGGDPASRNPQARRHVAKRQTVEGRAGPPAPWGKDAPAIARGSSCWQQCRLAIVRGMRSPARLRLFGDHGHGPECHKPFFRRACACSPVLPDLVQRMSRTATLWARGSTSADAAPPTATDHAPRASLHTARFEL